MTKLVIDKMAENYIKLVKLPANMTRFSSYYILQSMGLPRHSWKSILSNGTLVAFYIDSINFAITINTQVDSFFVSKNDDDDDLEDDNDDTWVGKNKEPINNTFDVMDEM